MGSFIAEFVYDLAFDMHYENKFLNLENILEMKISRCLKKTDDIPCKIPIKLDISDIAR